MTKERLLEELRKAQRMINPETAHHHADCAILVFLDDEEIYAEWSKIKRYYCEQK